MKKILVVTSLAAGIMTGGIAASPAPAVSSERAKGAFRNLKVLPQDIEPGKLQEIMVDEFNSGLGVGCGFCHAGEQGSHQLDYASDAKHTKEIARRMMRMTIRLNRRDFQVRRPMIGDKTLFVTCTTCHRGQPRPEEEE